MLTLNDGRAELWQWDTGRTLAVDADCSQVHFSNKVFGRSIDVDVIDGAAVIPDILLQTDKDLNVWAFVGTAEIGYTKISKTFTVNRRNKPADYVFTPVDQKTLDDLQSQIGDLADLTTEAKDTLVAAINEAARTGGGAGSMELRVAGGYIQYSTDGGMTWTNLIAMADLKGDPGAPGKDGADGKSAYQYAQEGGYTGTETAFAEKLAQEQLTGTTDYLTPTQVYEAVSAGIPVKVQYTDSTYGLLSFTAFNVAESLNKVVSQAIVYYNGVYILAELNGDKTDNIWYFIATTLAQKTDIPSALPNPNALTVTSGSDSVTYDGSAAKSIDIPSLDEIVTETTQVLPAYTNLIPTSTDASGTILNGVGYENGTLRSNGAVSAGAGFVSGFIPVKKGDIVRIKDPANASFSLDNAVALYKLDKAVSAGIGKYIRGMQSSAAYGGLTIDGNVLTWNTSSINYYAWQDFKYLRVMTSSADSIVTINEEIIESTQTVLTLKPTVKVEKENLDFTVNETMLAGRKIVVFGDSLIGMTRDSTSVPAYAAAYTGATVYNVGFGGCRMSKHPTNGYAAFSMWALADAVATGDYSTQEAQAPSGQDYFASQLAVLESIDFETVDAIVIHYGTNDFTANVPIDDSSNLLSTDTVCGALRYSIKKLLTAFPKIKIFVSLPLYRTWDGVGAETYKNTLEKTLPEYDSAMKTVAENHNLPTIDGYKQLGVNSINSSAYLSDGTHLNDFGRKQFGEFIGGRLICGA